MTQGKSFHYQSRNTFLGGDRGKHTLLISSWDTAPAQPHCETAPSDSQQMGQERKGEQGRVGGNAKVSFCWETLMAGL